MNYYIRHVAWLYGCCCLLPLFGQAQTIPLKEAIDEAVRYYPLIRQKEHFSESSKAGIRAAKNEALPNIVFSEQQDFGTLNSQSGPSNAFYGYGVSSAGPVLAHQNWNAGFGALYLANINWDFFAFGKARQRVKVSEKIHQRDESDKTQEIFQLQIKVAATYLNLLTAQYLVRIQEANLSRTETLKTVVLGRAVHGLTAGVDSSQAQAEVADARIALLKAKDVADEQASRLRVLLGVPGQQRLYPDTIFMTILPASFGDSSVIGDTHPVLQFYKNRVAASNEAVSFIKTQKYPVFSLFSIYQTRASGFGSAYNGSEVSYSKGYWDGISPSRTNYVIGIGLTWNFTSLFRFEQQANSQAFVSKALQDDYESVRQELLAQQQLAATKLTNALASFHETPAQIKAAGDSYRQRSLMYKIGLSNITDVTQALYELNRAETDQAIAHINIWQALLLKAAAQGDLSLFLNEF